MPKVYNKHTDTDIPVDAVYVGRPSKWGNPFKMHSEKERVEVYNLYKVYLHTRPDLITDIEKELKGKDLVCWCAPKACHADLLLKLANRPSGR